MNLLDETQLAAWTLGRGWLGLEARGVRAIIPSTCYRGKFSRGGLVGANMAEGSLKGLTLTPVDSGLLWVHEIIPAEPAPTSVLRSLLGLGGDEGFGVGRPIVEFLNEYQRLHAVLSWCLACEWAVTFIAAPHRFLLTKPLGLQLSWRWGSDEPMQPDVAEIMVGMSFERVQEDDTGTQLD